MNSFANICCRFLVVAAITLLATPCFVQAADDADEKGADEKGFVLLHTDDDASGWGKGVHVKDGLVTGGGRYHKKQFSDFVLRFDFRVKAGANSGIGIRAALTGDAAYNGMELQVLEDTAKQYAKLKPYQYHGSIYGVAAAKRGSQKSIGEWNTEEISAKGSRIVVKVNDQVIVDADIAEASKDGTIDGKKHPGLHNVQGYLGILGHGGGVEFRKIRIKELK
ncbi:MAG: hypothetical protein ACI9HK_003753 [Pirellulaceae bacterium]|jgi:hypothetical protein